MRVIKILTIGMIVSVFLVGQAYSAPKGNNGKGNSGNSKSNNGKANKSKAKNKSASQTKGKAAVRKQQARRSHEAKQRREARNRSAQNRPNFNGDDDLAFHNRSARANNGRRNRVEMRKDKAPRVVELIESLTSARWSHNPQDTRGQGNLYSFFNLS